MYLKKLQLQGFKTFANKTEFLYDTGMTAIVGPNGSGKSNVADAIRWVLGEQRYSLLRGRKTEDVIFAGSNMKAGMGFAEASITFDNTDHVLPLDFNEVTITRRAYRTGENEYYINKSRVRLKDIQEATNGIFSNYSVITQGMVDAALSQKPEERRSLFEDAAAIGHYNQKKAEAEDRLNKTQDNMQRVSDILAEIGPRLGSLEKNAKQAEEYYALQEELQTLLRRWYGFRWRKANRATENAREKEARARAELEKSRVDLEELKEQVTALRSSQNERRAALALFHRDSGALHSRAQQLQQQVAVDQERLNGLTRQREAHQQELVNLGVQVEGNLTRQASLEQELKGSREEQALIAGQIAEQDALLKSRNTATRQAEQELAKGREEISRAAAKLENLTHRSQQLAERRAELNRQQQQFNQQKEAGLARRQEIQQQLTTTQDQLAALEAEAGKIATRRKNLDAEIASLNETIRQNERKLQETRAKRDATRSRLELLTRLQNSFTGLHSGVKSVLQAAQSPKIGLKGILGLVANLLEAPAELELAIETALGGHLQDIVVERWSDAEAAISYLKSEGAGRATFLPLDTLRGGNSGRLDRNVLNAWGVRGIASELISFDLAYRVVYEQLLGRVLVVEDLKVARATLDSLPSGWTAVTLGGEIARSNGSVSGGNQGKDKAESGMLMRERELRELPREIAKLEKQASQFTEQNNEKQRELTTLRQQLSEVERESQQLGRNQQLTREKLASLRSLADRVTDELRLRDENFQSLAGELAGLDDREKGLVNERKETEKLQVDTEAALKGLERAVKLAQQNEQDEREKLANLRTTTALTGQRLHTLENNLNQARAEQKKLAEQIAAREKQLSEFEGRQQGLQNDLEAAQSELTGLNDQLGALRADIAPLEKELERLESEQTQTEKRWNDLGAQLLSLEAAHSRAELAVQRYQNELENLLVQATADLAPSLQAEQGEQVTINPADFTELLELEEGEARQLQERIEQGRAKIRAIGAINPLALQEFKAESQRFEFLSHQLTDLEQAANSLRALIKELDQVTQQRFAATFELVAEQFRKYFVQLFNGGSAKLYLTNPDKIAETGIEILAQPPGKRQQNLALLSGGERSMTAVALLFALLEVNPTPFCVLDEVDAALDEANVKRFCDTLRQLSHRTQFVVITHNRATIEAARTIYGISIGPDSVSKTISLRLDEVMKFRTATTQKAAVVAS